MEPLLIYTPKSSTRLVYVLDWIFRERLGVEYTLLHGDPGADASSFAICYGTSKANCFNIPDMGLLWKSNVEQFDIAQGEWRGIPTLFHNNNNAAIPFDVFSAVFFLLSRYEEYWPFTSDRHNRYPASASILLKNIDRPIVDEWIEGLKQELISAGVTIHQKPFSFRPTYDIDIAWSYKNKSLPRTVGAISRDLFYGKLTAVRNRISVLSSLSDDPYDSFLRLSDLHKKNSLSPVYFILSALETTAFDKNIPLKNPEMSSLVQRLSEEGTIGIHPSYYVDKRPELLLREKRDLEHVLASKVSVSRQHYIKSSIPTTYHALIAASITDDYSMGYGGKLGFRAGTGCSFFWYDLSKETQTSLRVHPFCFMDTTAHYDEGLTNEQALARLESYATVLQQTRSSLVTVFHNFSLGTEPEWSGWAEWYEQFVGRYAEFSIS
jgi:hypothetical protein